MRRVRKSRGAKEVELDITAFMNLMIVLVPVLLLGMVFSQITVLDIKLPESAVGESADANKIKQLELIIRDEEMLLNYPRGILLKRIPKLAVELQADSPSDQSVVSEADAAQLETPVAAYDFKLLSLVLQEIKRQLREKGIENRAITVLSEADTSYQTIISTMDTVRSYKAVVAVSVVNAELFPDVSFGDAPPLAVASAGGVK